MSYWTTYRNFSIVWLSLMLLLVGLSSCFKSPVEHRIKIGDGDTLVRFHLTDSVLYTMNNRSVFIYDLPSIANPQFVQEWHLGFGIGEVGHSDSILYFASRSGLQLLDLRNPYRLEFISNYDGVSSCSPTVLHRPVAYVLGPKWRCEYGKSSLEIVDLRNIQSPDFFFSHNLEDARALAMDGNQLFVCDGSGGLKLYSTENAFELSLIAVVDTIEALDIELQNGLALVKGPKALYQIDYSDSLNLALLARIPYFPPSPLYED